MNAAELLIECLEVEGVERVYGLPGEELEDLLFALRDSSIEFVPVRHEQGAAFMANVHGRLTGEVGVCLATLGPGATNLLTGVADAQLDKAPLVAITGQSEREQLHKESHQTLNVVNLFAPITKWNAQIGEAQIVPEAVRKAVKRAEHEKPGAVHLELPDDVGSEVIDADPLPVRDSVRRPEPSREAVVEAMELLAAAEQPIVLVGNGVIRTRASGELRTFAERLGAPVVATFMGKGAISDRDERSLYTLKSGPDDEAERALARADCVLAIGFDIAEHDPADWNPDPDRTVIHVDHEPAEVYRNYDPDVEVVADVARALVAFTERLETTFDSWCSDLRERIVANATRRPDPDDPLSVRGTLPLLREAMADEDVLVSDVGSHKQIIARNFPTYEPNTCIISNGLASMGIAVPGAIAADQVVDGNVVAATGDGGFMMNAVELATAERSDCGFTVVLFDDGQHRAITEQQLAHRGEHFGTELTNPDFVAFTESFGVEAREPETWPEVEQTLEDAIESRELTLVVVPIE